MPTAPLRPCANTRCPTLVARGYCDDCKPLVAQRPSYSDRPTSAQRGYGSRWQKARATYLRSHPLCVHCKDEQRITAANTVDHIEPHRGDQGKFWNPLNWQALCTTHHNAKTASGL